MMQTDVKAAHVEATGQLYPGVIALRPIIVFLVEQREILFFGTEVLLAQFVCNLILVRARNQFHYLFPAKAFCLPRTSM